MNKQQYLFLSILMLLSIGFFVFFLKYNHVTEQDQVDTDSNRAINNNFVLEYSYKGDNRWEYTVTGQLPNPCYQVSTDVLVAESYPEQVSVIVSVTPPDEDVICAQVISEYKYSGEFSASEKATVALQVK